MTEKETVEQILHTASRLFAQKGFAETSMNDIVKASGVSKGGIYWHFKSKDDIILAVVETMFSEQVAFLDEALTEQGTAKERLLALVENIAASLTHMQDTVPSPLDIYALTGRNGALMTLIKNFFGQYQAHLAQLIQQGIDEGDFYVTDPQDTAFIFISSSEGLILISYVTQKQETLPQSLSHAAHLFLRGLQNPNQEE